MDIRQISQSDVALIYILDILSSDVYVETPIVVSFQDVTGLALQGGAKIMDHPVHTTSFLQTVQF